MRLALLALLALTPRISMAAEATAPAPAPELIRPAPVRLYDRPSPLAGDALSYGARLTLANPVTASTLAENRAVAAVHVDAAAAERGQISAVVKAVQHTPAIVFGHFQSADDPFLKPKMDEGLLGAVLDRAPNLKETLKFLRKLYVPPLGQRSVGPSDVTEYLTDIPDFVGKNNQVLVGGVSIADSRGARNIGSIVKAKARGLRLIHVDASALSPAEASRVERAAKSAGIALSGAASSREEARAMYARGYRHVIVGSDEDAVRAGFGKYADVPLDAAREPARGWLERGKIATLGFLMSPDAALARLLAAKTHALWIDAEDGQFPLSKIKELIAGLPPGTPAVVRTTQFDNPDIPAYVAAGAAGVIAPQVSTVWQARRFVETVKRADPRAAAIVMIETRAGLANVEEIARVPGIDALFIGPHDLSLSMGLPKDDPKFKAAVARIEAAARAVGVPLAGLASSRSQAYAMRARGYGLAATVSDQGAVAEHFKSVLAEPPSPGPAMRSARQADIPRIIGLLRATNLYSEDFDRPESFREKIAADPDSIILLEREGTVAGMVMTTFDPWASFAWHLAVDPAVQGQGLGESLLREAERRLKAKGAKSVSAYILPENARSPALFKKRGYAEMPTPIVAVDKRLP